MAGIEDTEETYGGSLFQIQVVATGDVQFTDGGKAFAKLRPTVSDDDVADRSCLQVRRSSSLAYLYPVTLSSNYLVVLFGWNWF